MATGSGITWLAGDDATFEEALAVGADVRAAAVAAAARLPAKDLGRLYPSTMQDAVSIVHARLEENKRKAAASKQKSKSKAGAPHSPSDSHFRGARPGSGDPSAFWMYIEDYFRDFTRDDLRALLPLLRDPRDDPAFKVPPSGRRVDDDPTQRKLAATKAAAEAAAAKAAASRLGSEWDGDATSRPSLDGSPDAERRSSRLVSRHCKEEEVRRQQELEAQALAAATAAEQAEAAAAAAATRAMAVVPTTASGTPAQQLLDVLPEQRVALLLQQLTELQQLCGAEPFSTSDCSPAVRDALAQLQASAAAGSKPEDIEPAVRSELGEWLRGQLAALARRLGCSVPVLPPWAGLVPEPAPAPASSKQEQQGKGGKAAEKEDGKREQPGSKSGGGRKKGKAAAAADKERGAAEKEKQEAAAAPNSLQQRGQLPTAAYLHPYTELMLRFPVPQHTVQAAVEVPVAPEVLLPPTRTATMGQDAAAAASEAAAAAATEGEAATPAASFLTATPGSMGKLPEAPSVANLSSLAQAEQAADAGAGADTAGTAEDLASPAADQAAGDDGTPGDGTAGEDGAPAAGGTARAGGRARAVSNYALLAGKKQTNRGATGPPKKVVRQQTQRQEAEAAAQHPVARAVAAFVAAGDPEAPAADQWRACVGHHDELLAAAPEDEVLAEMLALQNELMAVAAANRARLVPALAGVLGELDARQAEAALQAKEEEDVQAWILKMRELHRQQHRQRREQAHAEALAAKKQTIMASPRPVLGRQRGAYHESGGGDGGGEGREGSPALQYALRPDELYDVLAQREADQEAFCAVCGDGHSEAPNQIVFCERCDVAVHQQCYGIATVPDGEWLCEPCREHEALLREQGVPEPDIRPPGWATNPDRKPLEGGARSCRCALCPIKYGAFKRAADGQRWVHSACALWAPETFLSYSEVPGQGRREFVAGLEKVKGDRLEGRCAICGLTDGAVMACQQPGGCHNAFHVLCARNIGLYLTIRPDPARKSAVQYRIYCALHSAAQQARDEKAWQERLEKAAQQQQKESKAKQAERLAAGRKQLESWEGERYLLHTLRANLETCRMLIDVTKRRERLKKQLVTLQQQEWPLLLADPPAALLDQQGGMQALPQFAGMPGMQLSGQQAAGMLPLQGMPIGGGSGLAILPPGMQQGLGQGVQPALIPLPQAHGTPSFALEMFGGQQQQQQQQLQHLQRLQQQAQPGMPSVPHHFFMQGQPATLSSAAAAFPGLDLQLQQSAASVLQHPLPATAPGALRAAGAVAAQVPADVAAAMMTAPAGMVPLQIPPSVQFPGVDPSVLAAMQGQPVAMGAAAAATAVAPSPRGTPRGASPAASAGAGWPKRGGTSAQPGSSKRRRVGSEDAATPTAGAMMPPPPPSQPLAAADPTAGGAASAAGRRQRTASAKVRENLLQRERQMTVEEAEQLNARLPGVLRYMPAAELDASLGAPPGWPVARPAQGAGQRQAGKPPPSKPSRSGK